MPHGASNLPRHSGKKPDKIIRQALMVALNREAEASDGTLTKKLHLMADKAVQLAIDGDVEAMKYITDRVEGRAPQAVTIQEPDGAAFTGSNSDLARLVAFLVARDARQREAAATPEDVVPPTVQ